MSQLVVDSMPFELCEECDKLNLRIVANTRAMEMEVGSSLLQEIRRCQLEDENVQEMKRDIKEEKSHGFSEDNEGVLWYKGRICVPNIKELKDKILHDPSPPTASSVVWHSKTDPDPILSPVATVMKGADHRRAPPIHSTAFYVPYSM
jgi:hypothetical protein